MPVGKPRPQYRPSDASRFANIALDGLNDITPQNTSYVHLGDGKIGKAEVQCSILHDESQWGKLHYRGGTVRCAGIIHLEIVFKGIREYALDSATIRVVLDGEHQLLRSYRSIVGQDEKKNDRMGVASNMVEVRDVGPRSIAGMPTEVLKKHGFTLRPEVQAGGVSVTALEASTEKEWAQLARWVFAGHRWRTGTSAVANSAEWTLTKNSAEDSPSHGDTFRTAFVFVNDGQPFLLKVEIEGALSRKRDKARENWKRGFRFGPSHATPAPTALIRGFEKETLRLNPFEARLQQDMIRANSTVDFNRQADEPAQNPPTKDEVEDDDDATLRQDEDEQNDAQAGMMEKTPSFAEFARRVAESDHGFRYKPQVDINETRYNKPPIQPPASQQVKIVQQEESKLLLSLFLTLCRELLGRIQQLMLG